jgi:hypothetical protein
MAIIYSYPTVVPERTDLVLGTDVSANGKPTKNFSIQGIIDLVTVATGDLQTVLDLGFIATGRDIVLGSVNVPAQTIHAGTFTTGPGSAVIVGAVGTGFTDFQSTRIIGTIQAQTAAQPNITSLGTLTSLSVNTSVTGTAVATTITAPGNNLQIASTKAIVDYIGSQPSPENLFKTLGAGNKAYDTTAAGNPGFDIDMGVTGTTNGNILFGDNKKIKMGDFGVTYPFESFYGGDPGPSTDTVAILQNKTASVALTLRSNILDLSSVGSVNPSVTPQKYLTATKYADAASTGVILYYNNINKLETTATGIDVTGITTTDNIINPGYYNASNGVGTDGFLLSSTGTGTTTTWVANPNPTPYLWKIEGDSGAITTVANADTIHFKGMNDGGTPLVGITTAFVPASKELRITANGLADGDGQAGEVAFWSGTGLTSTLAGDTGMTYDAATDNLTVAGIIQGGTLSDGTASISSGVGAAFKSITTTIDATANNANGFFGPLRTNAASTNYVAGVSDQAVQLTGTGTINLNAGGSEVASTTGTYKAGAVISLDVTLNNDAVIGKVLTGLSVPATGNSIEPDDSILIAFGKLQAQHNTSVNGLRYIGTWDARTQAEGGSVGDEGNPALADGGGVITTGTNTSIVADQLVDSGKDFTALGVAIGERVYNQAGAFTTVSAVGTTTLTLNEDIFLTNGQTYSVDDNPALNQGEYYVVNQAGTVDLNGNASWAIGDWVIAGAGNTWEKLDQTGVDGTGSINRIPRWNTVSSLNDSIILQSSTGITLDTGKNFATVGAGTITSASTFNANGDIIMSSATGVSLPVGGYGTAGQVLTSPATPATGTPLVWSTPTTGTVESVGAGAGIVLTGDAVDPVVNVDYLGTDNIVLSAGAAVTPVGADTIIINDATNGNVVKALISNLPFNDFSWIIEADSGTGSPYTIASGDTIDFVGVGNVSTAWDNTTKELRISTSSDPGSGTQFTLPVWDTTTSLGDSMVKQDAATGTTLTISGLEPLVIIDDTTTDKGSLTISRAADATTYMSSGTSTSGSETFGTHIFSQTDGTTPRSVITLNADRTTTFSDNIVIDQGNSGISRIHTGSVDGSDSGGLTLSGAGGTSAGRAAYIVLSGNENTGDARMLTGNTANAKLYLIAGATSGSTIRMQTAGTDTLVLDHSKNATFAGSITTNLSSAGTYFTGGSGGTRQLSITSGTNISAHALHTFNIASSNGKYEFDVNGTTELSLNGSSAAFAGNVEIDGNLTVDGQIIHGGGGSGTIVAKGGTFSDTIVCPLGSTTEAFSIDRATNGSMVFDVYFTNDTNGTSHSIAKKFTVVKQWGTATDTVASFKILDSGGQSSDFTPTFISWSNTTMRCRITPVTAAQTVTYTIVLGAGSQDATIVLN